ncbi:MAG: zinc ribbon domain-containing protein [Planctomycetes bacterium]|nr:zinc ribbon domain-containing protein [Planctomycetota bacterium]
MPTYDYQCQQCGHAFEKFQKMSESVLKKCPECGERALKRLMGTGAGVIFKGKGFWQTDSKTKKAAPPAKCDAITDGSAPATPCASCPAAKE